MEHRYPSGISSIYEAEGDQQRFIESIREAHGARPSGLVLVFYCSRTFHGKTLVEELRQLLPGVTCCGCTSCGEVTPEGLDSGCAVAILFPASQFQAAATLLQSINDLGLEDIVHEVASLKQQLQAQNTSPSQGKTQEPANEKAVFAISLIDGLSYSEESVTSAIKIGLGEIPLIGGSAGDSMEFTRTEQFCNEQLSSNSAVLILVHSKLAFETFTNRNFIPTEQKFVVTETDPDARKVFEFNAEPAAFEYAKAVGLSTSELTPEVFASNPVVLRVGGEIYCRSIQKVNEDYSLTFFSAIDNGIVLTLAQSKGMVASTRDMLARLGSNLGGIDMILGFDCMLRRLDASNRGVNDSISLLYRENNVVGFGTYGEQYDSMHLNQTFTGVAFSMAAREDEH